MGLISDLFDVLKPREEDTRSDDEKIADHWANMSDEEAEREIDKMIPKCP